MSYGIYYNRVFIRVEDQFVPLVNQGSNSWFISAMSERQRQ